MPRKPESAPAQSQAWSPQSADVLAQWAMDRLVNRTDGFGHYKPPPTGGSFTDKNELTLAVLGRHFRGESGCTIGLHTTSLRNQCRWAAWDFDNHGDGGADVVQTNLDAALILADAIRGFGIEPIIEDSDGRGGLHVWALLSGEPVSSRRVHAWANEIVRGLGDRVRPEVFPKQASIGTKGWGNFIRIPGRHHKRPHWSRFLVGGEWYSGDDAATWLADQVGGPPDLIPEIGGGDVGGEIAAPVVADGVGTTIGGDDDGGGEDFVTAVAMLRRLPERYRDTYDLWVKVGMILHSVDAGPEMLLIWDRWSKRSGKYEPGACEKKWGSFKSTPIGGLTVATLVSWAGHDRADDAIARLESSRGRAESGGPAPAADGSDETGGGRTPQQDAKKRKDLQTISEALGVTVDKIVQRGEDTGFEGYIVTIGGKDVSIGRVGDLLSYDKFRQAVFVATQQLLALTRKQWSKLVSHFGSVVDVEPIEEETYAGRLRAILDDYFDDNPPMAARHAEEATEAGRPYVSEGMIYLSVPALMKWTRPQRIQLQSPYKLLRLCGWVRHCKWKAGVTQRWWCCPIDSASVPDIARDKGDSE